MFLVPKNAWANRQKAAARLAFASRPACRLLRQADLLRGERARCFGL